MITLAGLFVSIVIKLTTADNALSNATQVKYQDIPELNDDESCVPGHVYRKECNLCKCSKTGLICTKMLCLDYNKSINSKKEKTLRGGKKEEESKGEHIEKPPKEECKPGTIYKKALKRCFCDNNKVLICTLIEKLYSNQNNANSQIYNLEDIRPPFKRTEVAKLPRLQDRIGNCIPGKAYKVNCNICVCLKTHDLICDKKLCLSLEVTHRMAAEHISGKPCTSRIVHEDKECIKCKCVDNKQTCQEIPGCITKTEKEQVPRENGEVRAAFDQVEEQCVPWKVYKQDCNDCICQYDKTLRCTQRRCLTYSLYKSLEKQRLYLLKHGL